MRGAHRLVVEAIEHERAFEVEIACERDLRHAAAGRSEPALPHSSMLSPGAIASSFALVSFASSSGEPVKTGNVP